jgi:flagellar motility protein MotE (MotC chaperone)
MPHRTSPSRAARRGRPSAPLGALTVALWIGACDFDPEPAAPPTSASAPKDDSAASGGSGGSGDSGEPDTDATETTPGEDAGRNSEGTDPLAQAHDDLAQDLAAAAALREEERLAVATSQQALARARAELDARLAAVEALEQRIDRRLGVGRVARERRQERISALSRLVSTMPPQAAAEMIARMSDAEAQAILVAVGQTSDRRAAKLLALMPAERAAALSQLYLDSDPEVVTPPEAPDAEAPDAQPLAQTTPSAPKADAADAPSTTSPPASPPPEAPGAEPTPG